MRNLRRQTGSGSWVESFASLFGGKGGLPTAQTVLVPLVGSSLDESALKVAGEVARESPALPWKVFVPLAVPGLMDYQT